MCHIFLYSDFIYQGRGCRTTTNSGSVNMSYPLFLRIYQGVTICVRACLVMLLVTLFLARELQWRKLVHNFNLLSLALGFIRAIL
jgi:hypothetical protein